MTYRALITWPLLLSQVLLFGTSLFAMIVVPQGAGNGEEIRRRLAVVWRPLALVLCVVSLPALLIETSSMAAVTWRQALPLVPEVMRQTHAGRIWAWRLAATAAVLVTAWWPAPRWWKPPAVGGLGAVLLLLGSLSGHAIDKGAPAVVLYFVHEVAAGLWIGALLGLGIGAMAGEGTAWVAETAARVSRLAGWCIAALVLTGGYAAYVSLGFSVDALLDSAYGRTLLCKIVGVGLTLGVGGYNRYALMPALHEPSARQALLRNVAVECALLVLVLGVTALLANTPPAHGQGAG